MKRREFLRYLAYNACAVSCWALGNPFALGFSSVQAASGKTLVIVFQRGGCDGLNTVVPHGDEEYYRLRHNLAIAPPSLGDPDSALDLDGFFGLHPALVPLSSIYDAGDLAVLPAVHYDGAPNSHFESQKFIESGAIRHDLDGWLNRHLLTRNAPGALRAVNFGDHLAHALSGEFAVRSFTDLQDFNLGVHPDDEAVILDRLAPIYDQPGRKAQHYGALMYNTAQLLLQDYAMIQDLDIAGYRPTNGAQYPASLLGKQLMQTALLIKSGLGLEVVALSCGGWDTHINQGGAGGQQAKALAGFGGALQAFYTDLGGRMSDVLVLTMTEFGRTAANNASFGTDHGHASAWFALGKGVNGGIHLGPSGWPGLFEDQLVDGRSLQHSVDYRDVLAEVISGHLGNTKLNVVVPNHAYSPIGFLN
jgi:uncharacterized protein (DUF1501 family)